VRGSDQGHIHHGVQHGRGGREEAEEGGREEGEAWLRMRTYLSGIASS
jgi:hypothetical protein